MESSIEQRDSLLTDLRERSVTQRRRLAEVRAREHVGAAGWAQNAALDSLVRVGREGLAATETLRHVVTLTTEQLRALLLLAVGEEGDGHLSALQDIVDRGNEQIGVAQALEEVICRALDEVSVTPLDEVNVQRLQHILVRVQGQVNALNTLMEAAHAQAQTLEQVAALDKVSAEHQKRVQDLQNLSVEEEAEALGTAGKAIVQRLAGLDEAQEQQLQSLKTIAQAVVEHVPDTSASPEEQAATLDELAQTAHERAGELREANGEAADTQPA